MNLLSASSVAFLLLLPVAHAEVLAPPLSLTDTFQLAVTGPHLTDATLELDTGQVQHLGGQNTSRLQFTATGIPDGAHAWVLRYHDEDGAHVERGIVSIQDITSVLVAQVQRAVDASESAQIEALASQEASFAAWNASLEARQASREAVAIARQIPTDLVRRDDLAPFATGMQDLAGTAELTRQDVEAGMMNQSRALEDGRAALTGIQRTVGDLLVLASLSILLAGIYLVRQGRELRRLKHERKLVEDRLKSLEARPVPKPEPAPKPIIERDAPLPTGFPPRPGFPRPPRPSRGPRKMPPPDSDSEGDEHE